MRPGGVIIPTPMEDGPGRRSCGACIWGTVISVPAQTEEHTKKGTRRKLSFLCRTSTPRNGTNDNRRGRYQRMYINDENMFYWLMISAEKGDTFVFFGEYQEHEYYARERHKGGYYDKSEDKILKIGRDFYVQFAIPAQAILDPVGYAQRFQRAADEHFGFQNDLEIGPTDTEEEPGDDIWDGDDY